LEVSVIRKDLAEAKSMWSSMQSIQKNKELHVHHQTEEDLTSQGAPTSDGIPVGMPGIPARPKAGTIAGTDSPKMIPAASHKSKAFSVDPKILDEICSMKRGISDVDEKVRGGGYHLKP